MVKQFEIKGIQTYEINEHQGAYYLWRELGVKRQSLVHVDAHHDMWDEVETNANGEYRPHCGNYILPAIRERMLKEVWWLNPFSISKYCLNVFKEGKTPKSHVFRGFPSPRLRWNDRDFENTLDKMIPPENVLRDFSSYILDIDLDAFSCCASLPPVEFPCSVLESDDAIYSAERDYFPRISRVLGTLSSLQRPEMIILARSQGRHGRNRYIKPKFLRPVKKELIQGLERIFS